MKHLIVRLAFSSATVVLLILIGWVGECVINVIACHCNNLGINISTDADLPQISDFFYRNYLLNREHFICSLTPFMILSVGLIGIRPVESKQSLYWLAFCGLWLSIFGYFLLFIGALLAPFFILARDGGDSVIPSTVMYVNIAIITLLVAYYLIAYFRRRRG